MDYTISVDALNPEGTTSVDILNLDLQQFNVLVKALSHPSLLCGKSANETYLIEQMIEDFGLAQTRIERMGTPTQRELEDGD